MFEPPDLVLWSIPVLCFGGVDSESGAGFAPLSLSFPSSAFGSWLGWIYSLTIASALPVYSSDQWPSSRRLSLAILHRSVLGSIGVISQIWVRSLIWIRIAFGTRAASPIYFTNMSSPGYTDYSQIPTSYNHTSP